MNVKLSALNCIHDELIGKKFDIVFPDNEHFIVTFVEKSNKGVGQYPIHSVPEEQLSTIKSKLKENV